MKDIDSVRLRDYLDSDWSRLFEFSGHAAPRRSLFSVFSPRFAPVALIRLAYCCNRSGLPRIAKFFSFLNLVIFGLEVPARLMIGPGLVMPHTVGTILGAGYIGANVTLYQQVTLGAKIADFDYDVSKRPHIEDGAIITAGAKIIGPVRIGVGAIVGANAVVLADVPDNHLAVGVPARIEPLPTKDAEKSSSNPPLQ